MYRAPLKYIDPSGHGICDAPGGGEDNPDCQDRQRDEELLALYEELGLSDVISFSMFVALIDLYHEAFDFTGGVRFEGSYWILPVVAADVNVDFIGNLSEMGGRIYIAIGLQGGVGSIGSINAGPVVGLDGTSVEEWDEISNHIGATASDDLLLALLSSEAGGILALLGLEPDYGWGSTADGGHRPQSFFLGTVGLGEEGAPLWAGTQIVGFDVLSGDASIGIGNWKAEGNIYDIFKALFVR